MIEYNIYEIKEKFTTAFIEKETEVTNFSKGIINLANLSKSSAENEIFEIPKENQIELNEKGETQFTIITKKIVVLKKQNLV